jgi:methionyl-tRNA formyltransferase
MSDKLRISFAGSAQFAAQHLSQLIASAKYDIVSVYTKPDKTAGRGQKITNNSVKQLALENNIPVLQPSVIDNKIIDKIHQDNLDVLIVVSYGMKIPSRLLDIPRYGCINVHASLLPKYRGASPIQAAILAGDTITGISIMRMDENIDTGDVLLQTKCDIASLDTSDSLFLKLATLGAVTLLEALDKLAELSLIPQNHAQASYCKKITKQDGAIDWQQDASIIALKIRAYNSWPVAFTQCGNKKIRIWEASVRTGTKSFVPADPGHIVSIEKDSLLVRCGTTKASYLLISKIQFPGKQALPLAQLLNSYREFFLRNKVFKNVS